MSSNLLLLQLSFERAGKVDGECALVGFEKWIEIQTFGYRLSSEKKSVEDLQKSLDTTERDRDAGPMSADEMVSADKERRDRFKAAQALMQARFQPRATTPAPAAPKAVSKSVVRCSLSEVGITKRFDGASPTLLKGFAAQDVVSEANIVVLARREEGAGVKMVQVAKFTLKKAMLTDVKLDLSASGGSAMVMDTLTIDTPQLTVEVYPEGGTSGALRFAYPVRA